MSTFTSTTTTDVWIKAKVAKATIDSLGLPVYEATNSRCSLRASCIESVTEGDTEHRDWEKTSIIETGRKAYVLWAPIDEILEALGLKRKSA